MCEVHPGGLPSLVEERAFSFIYYLSLIMIEELMVLAYHVSF